jgi:hypothetical protein
VAVAGLSPAPGAVAQGPTVGGCEVFPEDHVFNTPIDTLPVDANSNSYIATIGPGLPLKADFGSGLWDGGPIGIPYVTVPGTQTKYPADFYYDDSDPGPYAVPLDAPIEGGPDADGDRHAIAVDIDNCILYELFDAHPQAASWDAGSGAIFDLNGYELREDGWTSADAAGLPIFAGLVRYEEILAGEIKHAIRFTVPQTRGSYIWPARHEASGLTGLQYPPMGQRFRLKADFDISGFSETNQIILTALKKYGMILADNGSSWYMSGVPDERWDNDDLHELDAVLGSNFEAVDESSLMIDPDSGRARQPGQYMVEWTSDTTPASMTTGATQSVNQSFTNLGSLTWTNAGSNPVRLAYHWRNGACTSPGAVSVWEGMRTSLPAPIAQGGSVSDLAASVKAPSTAGTYCLQFDLVREGVTWFSWQGAAMRSTTVTVTQPVYGVSWGADTTPAAMAANAVQPVNLTFTNTGSLGWQSGGSNPVRLAYHWRNGVCPGSTNAVWDGQRTVLPGNVASGGSANSFAASVKAPASAGTYCLQYDLVREGVTWFSWQGAAMLSKTVTVNQPVYGVSWGADTTPASMSAGSMQSVNLTFTNTGSLAWQSGGANPVRLAYHWRSGACPGSGVSVWDGQRTAIPGNVASGATVSSLAAGVLAPSTPGAYCLQYDLVREGVTWFSWQGAGVLTRNVTVN